MVSTVGSQLEGPGFDSRGLPGAFQCGVLHVLPVSAWVSSRYA